MKGKGIKDIGGECGEHTREYSGRARKRLCMVGSGYGLGYFGEYGMEIRHCADYVYYNESMTLYSCLHYPSV